VRYGNELNIEGPNASTLVVFHRNHFGFPKQPCFFNAVACKTKRYLRAINRERHFAKQKLQATYVVFVTMRCNACFNAVSVFTQPREVGQYQVDAVHVGVWEHEPAVNEQQAIILLDDHAVSADLAETAEENYANWRCH
jgi:hypothetical protein